MTNKLKIGLLVFLSIVIVVARLFLVSRNVAELFVGNWGYWAMLVGVFLFTAHLGRFLVQKLTRVVWQKHRVGVLIALLAAIFLQLHEPRQFKVQFDEYTLSGVARNMHFLRQATFSGKAHIIDDRFQVFQVGIDKRPLFFSFTLSCLHDLTGYRPENVFVLNFTATFLLLLLTYYFGALSGGWKLGATCVALWAGLPLLAQNATGAGYDVFNVLMLGLLWFFGRQYLRSPSQFTLSLLVLTAVHLAQVRLESMLYVVFLVPIVIWQWLRRREIQLSWIAIISPLFLVVPLAINLVFVKSPNLFQTIQGQSYISLGHLVGNLEQAIWYLYNFDLTASNSIILSILGSVSIVAFFVKIFSMRKGFLKQEDEVLLILFSLFVVAATGVTMSQFWGQWSDAAAARFSLPMHLLFIFCFARVAGEFLKTRFLSVWVPVSAFVAAIVLSTSSAVASYATRALWSGREYAWFIKELDAPRYRDALVISHSIGPIIYNHAAIGVEVAESSKWKINECLKNGIYNDIVVLDRLIIDKETLQERSYNTDRAWDINRVSGVGDSGGALSAAFKRETISEIRLRGNVISRMSRIVKVEGPDAVPPKEYLERGPPFKTMQDQMMHLFSALP